MPDTRLARLRFCFAFVCALFLPVFLIFPAYGRKWMPTWAVAVTVLVAALGLGFGLRLVKVGRWPVWALSLLALVGVAGWSLTAVTAVSFWIFGGVEEHVEKGSPTCWEPAEFKKTDYCEGRDHSFMQGRLYYVVSKGVPRPKYCAQYLEGPHAGKGRCKSPRDFRERSCDSFGVPEGFRCFTCTDRASTGDDYHTLFAFDAKCTRGIAYDSVNVDLKEVPAKVESKKGSPGSALRTRVKSENP